MTDEEVRCGIAEANRAARASRRWLLVADLAQVAALAAILVGLMFALTSCSDDDCGRLDAAQLDAAQLDGAACGAPFTPCCPGNDVRCAPGSLCNASEICEPECFPFCPDGGQ